LTQKYVELSLYEGDKKSKFTNEYAKELGKEFMMISYDKANELSDYEVEFGINSVKDTMYLWENKHTPDSVLKQLLKLRNEWDDMVIHEPEVDETEQEEVVDVPEGVVPEFNLDEF